MLQKSTTLNISEQSISSESQSSLTTRPLKYPRSVIFIVISIVSKRFNTYDILTILVLYLTHKMSFDDDTATISYHLYVSLINFSALFGAILADSIFGRFKTIIYLTILHTIGTIIISVGAITTFNLPVTIFTIIGLILTGIGAGGVKPCLSVFGSEQFKLPEQKNHLAAFFSIIYFACNVGLLLAISLAPILRADVHCLGDNDCFYLAFGVPVFVTIITMGLFMSARPLYIMKKPTGNMLVLVTKCIIDALRTRCKEKNTAPKQHWLDYAEAKYGKQLIADIKIFLKISIMSLPMPLFWALFDQQQSRWVFQATQMSGNVADLFSIKPDQIPVLNPLLALVFIVLFDNVFYPILSKVGIKTPLQKIAIGGLLASVSFIFSGLVELKLESLGPEFPSAGMAQLRIYNGFSCNYDFITNISNHENFVLKNLSVFEEKNINVSNRLSFSYQAIPRNTTDCPKMSGELELDSNKAISYFLNRNGLERFEEKLEKNTKGFAVIRILSNIGEHSNDLELIGIRQKFIINGSDLHETPAGLYSLQYENFTKEIVLKEGGVYAYIIHKEGEAKYVYNSYILTQPNSLHMFWQFPQFIVMALGEVMYAINCIEFFYTQAPSSLRSVAQSLWIISIATGNLLVVIIIKFIKFNHQSLEFFTFAALMFFDMIVFILLALRYKYSNQTDSIEENNNRNKDTILKEYENPTFIHD